MMKQADQIKKADMQRTACQACKTNVFSCGMQMSALPYMHVVQGL